MPGFRVKVWWDWGTLEHIITLTLKLIFKIIIRHLTREQYVP